MFTHNTTTTNILFYEGIPSPIILYMRDKYFDKCRNTSQYNTQYYVTNIELTGRSLYTTTVCNT
jgi:hypothetical protein